MKKAPNALGLGSIFRAINRIPMVYKNPISSISKVLDVLFILFDLLLIQLGGLVSDGPAQPIGTQSRRWEE